MTTGRINQVAILAFLALKTKSIVFRAKEAKNSHRVGNRSTKNNLDTGPVSVSLIDYSVAQFASVFILLHS
jgi:hypothetical protein